MIGTQAGAVLRHLRHLVGADRADQRSDGELVRRFVAHRREEDFAALLRRHGPLVWCVCRQVLRHTQDAEDAFQATFLVLARRAAAVRKPESVASWLHGVARRTALQARAAAVRRHPPFPEEEDVAQDDPLAEVTVREMQGILHEELARLADSERAPLVLCYLEGKTQDEAAHQLGWSKSTFRRRLEQGRRRLNLRLSRRGVTLSAALCAGTLAAGTASALVPARLVRSTLQGAAPATAGTVAPRVAALAGEVSRTMFLSRCRVGITLLMVSGLLAAGMALAARAPDAGRQPSRKPPAGEADRPKVPQKQPVRTDRQGDPLPPDALARLGTTRFRHGFVIYHARFSRDGKRVFTGGAGRGVCVWDAATGKELRHFNERGYIYALALSPDDKVMAAATPGAANRISLWDMTTAKELRQLAGHQTGAPMALAFAPDGKMLASGGHDQMVRLWDVASGKELHRFEGHQNSVLTVAFTPDGKTLASGSIDRTVRLWDPATGKSRGVLAGHKEVVNGVAFAPDGAMLASGSDDGTVRLWDPATGKGRRTIDCRHGKVTALAFAPDSHILATGHGDNRICLWDVRTGKELRSWQAHPFRPTTLAFAPDGKTLISGGVWDTAIHFWEVATGKELRRFDAHSSAAIRLAYTGDGKTLLSAGRDRTVRAWDPASGAGRLVRTWEGQGLNTYDFSPDLKTLASSDFLDHSVRLWDLTSNRGPRVLGKHTDRIDCVAFAPDGKVLASGSKRGHIRLWDVAGARELRRLAGDEGEIGSLAFSPDGKILASGPPSLYTGGDPRGRAIRLWDVATGKELRRLEGAEEVYAIAISPDGKRLASAGGWNGKARLWDLATGQQVRPLTVPRGGYTVAFSPDSRLLAWAADERDNTVRVLETVTGKEVRCFRGHHSGVMSLAFAPDGRSLASGGGDSTILVWDVTGRRKNGRWSEAALSSRELEAHWTELAGDDAGKAFAASWALVAAPRQSVPFLARQLRPVGEADPKRLARLIADLDSKRFAERGKAVRELEQLADLAEPALRRALAGQPPLEVRRRLERLLAKLDWGGSPARLRTFRALAVLEHLGTPAARQLLQTLAGGEAHARITREARVILRRLGKPRP
jgi:RNA polymerase sigma factor (sigma-70 family)